MVSFATLELPGLKAWQVQRRNRVRRQLTAVAALVSALALGLMLGPDAVNPLIRLGIQSAADDQAVLARRARDVAAAISAREVLSTPRKLPILSDAKPVALPKPALAASELLCLARVAFYEARGENFEGQVAVAQLTMNRSKSSGRTICQTITDKVGDRGGVCLFPATCLAKGAQPDSSPAWLQSHWIAEEVAAGRAWLRELEHAEYFHTFHVGPPWRHMAQRVRRIGQHIFYAPASAPPADLSMARKVVLRWDEAALRSWTMPDVELVKHEHHILAATETVPTPPPSAHSISVRARPQPAAAIDQRDKPAFSPFSIEAQR